MKKISLLLAFAALLITACESGGGVEEEVGGEQTHKIELAYTYLDVNYEANSYTVSVTATCPWNATSNCEWISVDTKSGDASTEELSFLVECNEGEGERVGVITLQNSNYNLVVELFVFQQAYSPKITIEPNTLNFTADGGTQEVAITANCEYRISGIQEWITLTETDSGFIIDVTANIEAEERYAYIMINNEEYGIYEHISITQDGSAPQISIAPDTINFAGQGGTQEVIITANCIYDVSVTADWLSFIPTDSGIVISASNNYEIGGRSGEVTVSSDKYSLSKTITITQEGLTEEEYAKHLITYTTTDGAVITIWNTYRFEANIISHTYENGIGIIKFDAPITLIPEKAFWGVDSLESITIPDGVMSIDKDAFIGCSSLKNVTIGNNVTSIGHGAFSGCISLTDITFGDNVTEIGERAFYGCRALTSITFGDNVTEIGVCAFENCTSLTSVTIPDSVTTIRKSAFENCSSLTSVTIGKGVITIGEAAFSACTSLTGIEIPDNVTSIGDFAFNGCIGFISIALPNSITEISRYTFCECSNLISVTIPDSVTTINEGAFSYCDNLPSITIGEGVTTIGEGAFMWCHGLTEVTISESVTLIERAAFNGCTGLTTVYCKPTTPPTGNHNMFNGMFTVENPEGRKIYVPRNSVNTYKREMYWMNYLDYIVGYDF